VAKKNSIIMKMSKLNIGFSRYSDANFDVHSGSIIVCLTDNVYFKTLNPPLAVLQDAHLRYGTALQNAKSRSKDAVAEKNSSRSALIALLVVEGLYLMSEAAGDLQKLISTGYAIAKDGTNKVLLAPGATYVANGTNSGELEVSIDIPNGANSFGHEITDQLPDENTVWTKMPFNVSKYTYQGLVPGKQYWVRVVITGARKQVVYSPVATKFVQ
jgi:hypothetical protein